jgi:hypothetical protein
MGLKRVSAKDVEIAQLRGRIGELLCEIQGHERLLGVREERIRELKDEVAELKLLVNAKPLPFQDAGLANEHEATEPGNEFLERLTSAQYPPLPPKTTVWFSPPKGTEITAEEAAA